MKRNEATLNGTIRFEAVLPNISYHVQQVRTIPVLTTPLSLKLARRNNNSSGDIPKVGYVTLNQTRKIVPLLENDPAVCTTPLVGVWTAFDEVESTNGNENENEKNLSNFDRSDTQYQNKDQNSANSYLQNPLTWAILTRFLCSEHLRDKVFFEKETFLLVS